MWDLCLNPAIARRNDIRCILLYYTYPYMRAQIFRLCVVAHLAPYHHLGRCWITGDEDTGYLSEIGPVTYSVRLVVGSSNQLILIYPPRGISY